jgi:hypothetical protein
MGKGIYLTTFAERERERERVDGQLSDEVSVTSRVPQRSVLFPLLFLPYVNDIWRNTVV